jgi:hypothetical protein
MADFESILTGSRLTREYPAMVPDIVQLKEFSFLSHGEIGVS